MSTFTDIKKWNLSSNFGNSDQHDRQFRRQKFQSESSTPFAVSSPGVCYNSYILFISQLCRMYFVSSLCISVSLLNQVDNLLGMLHIDILHLQFFQFIELKNRLGLLPRSGIISLHNMHYLGFISFLLVFYERLRCAYYVNLPKYITRSPFDSEGETSII